MELQQRDVQTQVKHRILENYLKAWGGIILHGLRKPAAQMRQLGRRLTHHFVYVDCCASVGRYSCNTEDFFLERVTGPVPGSPVLSIRVLDGLTKMASRYSIDLRINAILVENDRDRFQGLLETLSSEGLLLRAKQTAALAGLAPGEIAVLNDDWTQVVDQLLKYTRKKYTKAFYLIDPYGPKGIPRHAVQSVVRHRDHDVMINFPYYDLQKKTGSTHTERHEAHIGHWTSVFGDEEWLRIVHDIESVRTSRDALLDAMGITARDAEGDPLFEELKRSGFLADRQLTELIERRLVDLYKETLLAIDPTLSAKRVRLRFPDKERPMFHLFLTTHDPSGALRLNKILYDARLWEHELRYIRRSALLQRPKDERQLSFLAPVVPEVPELEMPERPTTEECAEDISQSFAGKAATRRDVYRELADELYFPEEVDKAIRYLRRQGRATFGARLTNDAMIQFLTG
jgi:three-Cys-motif partner protein